MKKLASRGVRGLGLALGWALALALVWAAPAVQAQTGSAPRGMTPGFVVQPGQGPAPQRRAQALRAGSGSQFTYYPDTSLQACPDHKVLDHFFQEYYGDIPEQRAYTWCGAAQKAMDWANEADPLTWRRPYILESCNPGVDWHYSHAWEATPEMPEPGRYYSPAARGITLVCSPAPYPPEGCAAGKGGFATCPNNKPPITAPPLVDDINQNNGEPPPPPPPPEEPPRPMCRRQETQAPPAPPPDLVGNPILASTGNKFQKEVDYSGPGMLQMVRYYNASLKGWTHSYLMRLVIWENTETSTDTVAVVRPDGRIVVFQGKGQGPWAPNATVVERLTRLHPATAQEAAWKLVLADDTVELYNADGLPLSVKARGGLGVTLQYSGDGLLQTVTDLFGRSLGYGYDSSQRLAWVTAPGGETMSYVYNGDDQLDRVVHADGTYRQYLYDNSAFRTALVGIVDEMGNRYATWAYDSQGRAIRSEHAGGRHRYTLEYGANATVVTDPRGLQSTLQHQNVAGRMVLTGNSTPCANCSGDAASKVVDALGQVTQSTDYTGVVTQTVYDNSRHLPTSVTRAGGRPEAQTISTQWHPGYRVPVQIDEPGRRSSFEYNNQGNLTRATVLDTASGQTVSQTWAWTGGLLTAQTDALGRTTRYEYSGGNLVSATNAAGHVTQYSYDAASRLISTTYPGGAVASNSYDARGRLTSRSLTPAGGGAPEVETYTWRPTGQIAGAVLANAVSYTFTYDEAQQLYLVTDSLGNAVNYGYDPMGHRITTRYFDAQGRVLRQRDTQYNLLNRVSQIADTMGYRLVQLDYDANGQVASVADALNQRTSLTLDGLGRPVAMQYPGGATAALAYNALGQLTAATDPKGVQTGYTVDALGNVRATTSPDAGASTAQYDAAGNLVSRTDALGQATQYQYDKLGRLKRITWADGQEARFTYDGAANAVGLLTRMEDPQGSTDYSWDGFGRLASRTQALKNGATQTVRYSYSAGGELASITYPSGKVVAYTRQSGRVTGISIDGEPFVSDVDYTGLNAPKGWSWASGDSASRSYDADGRLAGSEIAAYALDGAGRITAIGQKLYMPTGTDTYALGVASYRIEYDSRDRITRFERDVPGGAPPPCSPCAPPPLLLRPREGAGALRAPTQVDPGPNDPAARFALVQTYSYDQNGNRTARLEQLRLINQNTGQLAAGLATQKTYGIDPASNRMLGLSQTITQTNAKGSVQSVVSLNVSYAVNAAGDQLGDGLKQYEHDASGRMARLSYQKSGTQMSVLYLHNAQGQRVFKSEPSADDTAPDGSVLDQSFLDWLHSRFAWLFANTKKSDRTKLGWAFVYEGTDMLGEYGTGGANSTGSTEYIYLPTEQGNVLVGAIINGEKYAVHTDHLGTPRRMTDSANQPVWQWGYSAFMDNEPSIAARNFKDRSWAFAKGELTDLADGVDNVDNGPQFGRKMVKLSYRANGLYFDDESNLLYNNRRTLDPNSNRYTQYDPIGLAGGPNGFVHVENNPLMFTDAMGLMGQGSGANAKGSGTTAAGANVTIGGGGSFHTPFGFGVGVDGGFAFDTKGNVCGYSNVCYTVGPGMSASAGAVGSTGSGVLSTGTTEYKGACWSGGAGVGGSGSVLFGDDGSAQVGRGLYGPSVGGAATYQTCRLQLVCAKN